MQHPRNVYVHEHEVTALLDAWIARALAPHRIKQTITDLRDALHAHGPDEKLVRARAKLAECDTKLDRLRASIEAGIDPVTVAKWIADANNQRALAEAVIRNATPDPQPHQLTDEDTQALIARVGGLAATLKTAEPADRQHAYRQLGVRLTYQPGEHEIHVELTFNPDPNGIGTRALPDVTITHALTMYEAES